MTSLVRKRGAVVEVIVGIHEAIRRETALRLTSAKAISRKRFTTESQRSEGGRQKTGGAFDKDNAIE